VLTQRYIGAMEASDTQSQGMARQWSTDGVDARGRLDYWVGAICEAFLEMDCSSRQALAFEGRLTSVEVGPLSFNQVEASTQDVYRTRAGVARSASHPFYLITQRQTPWHVRQGVIVSGCARAMRCWSTRPICTNCIFPSPWKSCPFSCPAPGSASG